MPRNTGWENGKAVRVKEATITLLKRFGPLILTGLAAVAEHHWLGHHDDSEDTKPRERADEPDDKYSIRKLEHEVADLKRSLSRKARDDEVEGEVRTSPRIREEIVREWRPPFREEQAQEQHFRGRPLPDTLPGPSIYLPYQQTPVAPPAQAPREVEIPAQFVEARDREYLRPSRRPRSIRRRHHRHRHSSVPNRSSYEDKDMHARRVAAIAGAVEAVHVADIRGDWIGPKGLRVGTTMAATYAASRSRDRDPDYSREGDAVVDIGAGLLVTRVVHGSSRKLEEDRKLPRRDRRRWSYCY